MKTKSAKSYTLAQVGKLLGVGHNTVYNYINVGLIKVSPAGPSAGKVGRVGRTVTEAEYQRLKRHGVDPTGIKAMLAERGPTRTTAKKKQAKRSASASAAASSAKKRVKRKATAASAKTQVKRAASAGTRKVAKKQRRK